jgi:hypothetical protein
MTDEKTSYETRTIRSLRGLEARTRLKWEADGWEVVSETPRGLRTDITVRRPRPRRPVLLYIVGGAVVALAIGALTLAGALSGDVPEEKSSAASSEPSRTVSRLPTPTSVDSPSPVATSAAVAADRDAEFEALLNLGDYCDPAIALFADEHEDQIVTFDGHIAALNNHGSSTTRYDILLGSGDFSPTTASGPAFQYRDVNTISDLNYSARTNDSVGVGTNLRLTARVGDSEPESCLFQLEPIETTFR